jgi:hypothetical protein
VPGPYYIYRTCCPRAHLVKLKHEPLKIAAKIGLPERTGSATLCEGPGSAARCNTTPPQNKKNKTNKKKKKNK